jgi:hypothetical protein
MNKPMIAQTHEVVPGGEAVAAQSRRPRPGQTNPTLGPPQTTPADLERVNRVISREVLDWMEAETARVRRATGELLNSSQMIRGVFGAMIDNHLNFGTCQSESDIRNVMGRYLRKVAELIVAERAAARKGEPRRP